MVNKVIAVVGCGHGELNLVYKRVIDYQIVQNTIVDLLIICGDFQATRNEEDLACMSSPMKYRKIVIKILIIDGFLGIL